MTRSPRSALRRPGTRPVLVALALALGLALAGCRPAPLAFPASLNAPRPEERVRAVKQAVTYPYASPEERRAVLDMLVARLEDDDDAVRFFAVLALQRMTGTRFGYNYHDPPEERTRAVQAWRRYLAQSSEQASELPSTATVPQAQTPSDGDPGGGAP